jgi:hypothetical protein
LHWQILRTRDDRYEDQRISSFGWRESVRRTAPQKQVIASPIVHFGLGDATSAEVVRSLANGAAVGVRREGRHHGEGHAAAQGSCPWLFAWDGGGLRFVTDLLWRSPAPHQRQATAAC